MTSPTYINAALPSKITPPEPGRFFDRPFLLGKLAELATSPRKIWISSPGGSGKTSLVRAFLASDPRPLIWYQVDGEDQDPANLFFYLSHTVAEDEVGEQPLPSFSPEYLPNLITFCHNYFRAYFARFPQGCALVFDDFQEGPGESFFGPVLMAATAELPQNSTLFVLSREEPYPSLARERLNRSLACLGWEDLRFSVQETQNFLVWSQGEEFLRQEMDRAYNLTQGWLAGLLLFLEHPTDAPLPQQFSADQTGLLFDYFTGEVFVRLPTETQSFLLACGLLPTINVSIAAKLTGRQDAAEILRELVRGNRFTFRISSTPEVFRFHPLFRHFLQVRAVQDLSVQQLKELQERAAQLLVADGQFEPAAELLIAAMAWHGLIELITAHAETLLRQFRTQTLLHWLDALPEERRRAEPCLCYWRGCCLFAEQPEVSKQELARAYELFEQRGDATGSMRSWSMAVNALMVGWNDFDELDIWIERFYQLRERYPEFPSPEIEALMVQSICKSLTWQQPARPDLPDWAARLYQLIMASNDNTFRIFAGSNLVFYHVVGGNLATARSMVEFLNQYLQSTDVMPLHKLIWLSVRAVVELVYLDRDSCLETIAAGRAIIEESGVHVYDLRLYGQAITLGLTLKDTKLVNSLMAEVSSMPISAALDRSFLSYLQADFSLLKGNVAESIALSEMAISAARKGGSKITMAFSLAVMALALHQDGQVERTAEVLEQGLKYSRGMNYFSSLFYLLAAYVALENSNREEAITLLREGFGRAAQQGYLNFHPWRDEIMAQLCREAIAAEIEVKYVKHLAHYRHLDINPSLTPSLTPKEIEIFTWIRDGKTNGEIAQILEISERTVKFHLSNILKKLGAKSRTQAVSIGLEYDIFDE